MRVQRLFNYGPIISQKYPTTQGQVLYQRFQKVLLECSPDPLCISLRGSIEDVSDERLPGRLRLQLPLHGGQAHAARSVIGDPKYAIAKVGYLISRLKVDKENPQGLPDLGQTHFGPNIFIYLVFLQWIVRDIAWLQLQTEQHLTTRLSAGARYEQ